MKKQSSFVSNLSVAQTLVIAVMTGIAVFLGAKALRSKPKPPPPPEPQDIRTLPVDNFENAIIRIHDKASGKFFCSGFVITKSLAITAAHCLADRNPDEESMTVIDSNNLSHDAAAKDASPQTDLGLIKGNFGSIEPIKIMTHPMQIEEAFSNGDLVSCGFPYGGALVCATFRSSGKKNVFRYKGESVMYPGMSGGPVYDKKTRNVLALNTGALEEEKVVSPLVNICTILDCNVK